RRPEQPGTPRGARLRRRLGDGDRAAGLPRGGHGRLMKLTLTQFVTLDGVSQGPGSAEEDPTDGFTDGGWLVPYLDGAFVQRTSDWLGLADGLLLGRRTYQAFARDWPRITDPADPFTARMNTLPKYVVSTTLAEGTWHPTTVLTGDPVRSVADLK